jgi:hypothetical protein
MERERATLLIERNTSRTTLKLKNIRDEKNFLNSWVENLFLFKLSFQYEDLKTLTIKLGVVAHTYDPNTWETNTGRL